MSLFFLLLAAFDPTLLASPIETHDPSTSAPIAATAPFSVMEVLREKGLHTTDNERWNIYGQLTYISSWKLPFSAAYTDLNGSKMSLQPTAERSFTGTLTFYAGVRLWRGAELQIVPELIGLRPLSHLAGLGSAIQNFELQKTGSQTPTPYLSRAFVRQTFNLGRNEVDKPPGQMQLGSTVSARRVVVTLGKLSVLDVLDKNLFAADLRNQYLNMAFMTHAAFDFAADSRGYSWGGFVEFYLDAWALRFNHMMAPLHPNQLGLDVHFWRVYGEQLELEHNHTLWGRAGATRLLLYRNLEQMGRFDDAVAAVRSNPSHNATRCSNFSYGSQNASAPDFCWVRRANTKKGIGLNIEQYITQDIGFFARGMLSDGETEVYSYTSTDQSYSLGVLARGGMWRRARDVLGLAFAQAFISQAHAAYLQAGGIDGFIGDGNLRHASERVLEAFYMANAYKTIWLTADYQHIANPGYNADRGPVNIFGARLHAEF
jgi:hypothetical protein